MRIAHVVSTFPPYKGGMGNVAQEIAERTAKRGDEVMVVTPEQRITSNESRIMDRNRSHNSLFIIHYSSPRLRFGNAAWCPGISRELERLQPDIVHLHWPFIGGVAPVFAWRCGDPHSANYSPIRANKRIVERHRRLIVQYHMDLIAPGWRGAAFAAYERWAVPRMVRFADRIIISSLDYAKCGTLAPYTKAMEGKVVEIPLGVDVGRFTPESHPPSPPLSAYGGFVEGGPEGGGENKNFSSSQKRGSPEASSGSRLASILKRRDGRGLRAQNAQGVGLHVLFVGGLDRAHAFKGLPILFEAIARVPDMRLQVVGDGDLRSTHEQQARTLGIADRVVFLGAVPDVQLPEVYRRADALVLPSTARSEAFGVVLLEAMASGIATIASSHPGVRTVIVDGETGFLVPPGDVAALSDRLDRLARDPDLAQCMGIAGRCRAETYYDWRQIGATWEQLYETVCQTI